MFSCSASAHSCVRSWLMLHFLWHRGSRSMRIGGMHTSGHAAALCEYGVLLRNGQCLGDASLVDLTGLVDNEEKLFGDGHQQFMCCCMAVAATYWDSPHGVRCELKDKDGPRGWRSGCGGLMAGSHSWHKMRQYTGADVPDVGKCVVQLRDVPDAVLCAAMPEAFFLDEGGVCRPLPVAAPADLVAKFGFQRTMCNPFAGWVSRTFYTEHNDIQGNRVAVRLRRTRNAVDLTLYRNQSWRIVMDWDSARSAVFVPRPEGDARVSQQLVGDDHGVSHFELVPARTGEGESFRPEVLRLHFLDGTVEELTSGVWFPPDFVSFLHQSALGEKSDIITDVNRHDHQQGAADLLDQAESGALDFSSRPIQNMVEPAGCVGKLLGKVVFAPLAGLAVLLDGVVAHGAVPHEDTAARITSAMWALIGNAAAASGCVLGALCSGPAAIAATPVALYRYYNVKNQLRISGVQQLFKELTCHKKLARCSPNVVAASGLICEAILASGGARVA